MTNFSRQQLAQVIATRTMENPSDDNLPIQVAAYLSEVKQISSLESLVRDVMEYRAQNGIIEATVSSAYAIDERLVKDIEILLKDAFPDAKEIILDQEIDSNLVGGVKVSLANQQLDMTVREKLDTFKRLTQDIKD